MPKKKSKGVMSEHQPLLGKFLLSMPNKKNSDMFYNSIIYVLFHSQIGSVGVVINRPVIKLPHKKILELLKTKKNSESDIENNDSITMFSGGNAEPYKFILLHGEEYKLQESREVNNGIYYVFPDNNILNDIIENKAPKNLLFISGYSFWGPGELENELYNDQWLLSDSNKKIMFMKNNSAKWRLAMNKLGAPYGLMLTRSAHA